MRKKPKMLFVDDDVSLVSSLGRVIGRAFEGRIDLTALTDSVAAKEWTRENSPDVVLSDLEMPIVDGFEILATAKLCNTFSQVILHTGYLSQETFHLALRMGASDYVAKCTDSRNLLDALEYAYRRTIRWQEMFRETAPFA